MLQLNRLIEGLVLGEQKNYSNSPGVYESFVSFRFVSFRSPYLFYLLTVGVEVVYFHLITLRYTHQPAELLWTSDQPVSETST
jgi:hypothetical protein